MNHKIIRRLFASAAAVALALTVSGCGGQAPNEANNDLGVVEGESTSVTKEDAVNALVSVCELNAYMADPESWEIGGSESADPLVIGLYGGDGGGAVEVAYSTSSGDGSLSIPAESYEWTNWSLANSGCEGIDGLDLSVLEVGESSSENEEQPSLAEVPNVLGQTESDAKATLRGLGFGFPTIRQAGYNPLVSCQTLGWGLIVKMTPSPGQLAELSKVGAIQLTVDCEQ